MTWFEYRPAALHDNRSATPHPQSSPFGYGAGVCAISLRAPRLWLALAISAPLLLSGAPALAQSPPAAAEKPDTDEVAARKHFERALELYRGGRYAAALTELQQAAERDPNGKDLFFNLALVHEKLGQLPEAIASLERFRELETDHAERERARLTIERLRGAEQAARIESPRDATPPCVAATSPPPPARHEPSPVLIGAASLAAVSLVVGTVFGLKALANDVGDAQTSDALPVNQLHQRARRAERDALVADVAFAVSAASAATFVGIWLLSPREPTRGAGITLRGYF
jgi:tetratricopeptide (TPR) repeat protein